MKLEIRRLSKSFPVTEGPFFSRKGSVAALNDITVSVEAGKSLGVVGESGSGKTTLAKILVGFLHADQGEAKLGDRDLLALKRKERARLVQMVFQDPFSSLNPKLLLKTQLLEAFRRPVSESGPQAAQLMADVGLSIDVLSRYPHQLSGGQRQRFAIARALASEPVLLLADEPVSSLDLSVQAQIINLLNALREKKRFTQIIISHDLAVIANTCDDVMVLKEGQLIEFGRVEDVLSNPQEEYTQRLLRAVPVY